MKIFDFYFLLLPGTRKHLYIAFVYKSGTHLIYKGMAG